MSKIILYRGLKEPQKLSATTKEDYQSAYLSYRIAQRERDVEAGKLANRAREAVIRKATTVSPQAGVMLSNSIPDPAAHSKKRLQHASHNEHLSPHQQFSDSLQIAMKYAGEDGYIVSIQPEMLEVEKYDWGTNHEQIEVAEGLYTSLPYTLYEIPSHELYENAVNWDIQEQPSAYFREGREASVKKENEYREGGGLRR